MDTFTKTESKLIEKYKITGDPHGTETFATRTNPYSGVHVHLNQFCTALVDATLRVYENYCRGDYASGKDFDRLKNLLVKVNPDAYFDLID